MAREAKVGIATVFRHFPTKEALLEAVLVRRLERLAEEGQRLMTETGPAHALFAFFDLVLHQSPVKNAFAAALADAGVDVRAAASEAGHALREVLIALLDGAQQAGVVRRDLEVPELTAILVGHLPHAGAPGRPRSPRCAPESRPRRTEGAHREPGRAIAARRLPLLK
ncbi:TetR/AcrR family transcriptional regulator [Streptomyces sp. NPDC056465]|uniref:TetR/AcrR family transcriptional regulator n=1 Tax=Streptomyces sp. NPDC056465 TaxID=3345829 RepID=UPI003695D2E6